jgi:hypothetical protein
MIVEEEHGEKIHSVENRTFWKIKQIDLQLYFNRKYSSTRYVLKIT